MLVAVAAVASSAPAGTSGPTASKTVVGVASGDKRFSTLVTLVKQAGLVKTLSGKGPFTVFAPTNAAFAKLKRTAPDTFAAVTSDKALLAKVLTYHVLAKRVPSTAAVAAAKKRAAVKTVQGERIKLSIRAGKLTLNGNSKVIAADVKASNGVIHAIDTVIVPPSLLAPPAPTKSIVELAVGNPQFSTLVSLVQKANLVQVLSGPGPFTVFAPTNEAFDKLKAAAPATYDAVVNDPTLLTKVLTYHALAGSVKSDQAIAGARQNGSVNSVQGEPIKLSLAAGKLTLNGTSTVITADVLATNGVIHAIDTVLVPPSLAG
jgi:transforming growth factor-beta-induced protein